MAKLAPVALKVKNAIEAKTNMCLNSRKPPIGTKAYRVGGIGNRINYTEKMLKNLPTEAKRALMTILGDGEIGGRACKDADCLHPCFGPLHASNCNKCYKTWVKSRGQMQSRSCGACDIDYTEWTEPHIMTFEEKMTEIGKEHLLQ